MGNGISENLSKANGAAHELKGKVQNVENHLEEMSRDAGKKIGALASDLTDSAAEYVKAGRMYVNENPAKSVVIAAAAGLIAGSLATLVMRRR
ncbi:MAG: hypothetical protein SGJ18_08710 [Pseudomonadota bacterium]|nr:hypothetical protein [Pseudomonadota bacterium]